MKMALNPKLNDIKFFPDGVSYNIVKLSALVANAADTVVTLITTKAPALANTLSAATQTIVYVDSGAVAQKTRVPDSGGLFKTDFTAPASSGGVTTAQMNTAITDAVKDFVTTTAMGTAITNGTKDLVTATAMGTAITNGTKDLATKLALKAVDDRVAVLEAKP